MKAKLILIVEDGIVNREMVSEILQKEEFYVRFAPNAATALRILIETIPFLILMDVIISKLNNCTLARILKNDEDTKDIKIIALSDENPDYERIIYCGFDGLINIEESKKSFVKEIRKI